MGNVEADFYSDWVNKLRKELGFLGYQVLSNSDKEIVYTFLSIQERLLEPRPRQVHRSKEFKCPIELQCDLYIVESAMRQGNDLTPYLSKFIRRADYDDPLLKHWGIHYLNLSTNKNSDQFEERTGTLLYAMFNSKRVYLINVYSHEECSLQKMVRILHNNWPESIALYKLQDVTGLDFSVNDQDIKWLINENFNTYIKVNPNIVYAPMGGGLASLSISNDLKRQANSIKAKLKEMESYIVNNIEEIKEMATSMGISLPENPRFKIKDHGGKFYAVEAYTGLWVQL